VVFFVLVRAPSHRMPEAAAREATSQAVESMSYEWRGGIPKWRYTESNCLVSILLCASGMKCRAEGSGMHVMKHAMVRL
jgi:hypothetical protein